ncbi:MAG: DHH family phosphoesterase [Coriobacteriales bacterium]|jgi:phosphoesterase RecJ-like protein|nr:DHH family phosphoesterase [Coriobacteriales bacterium]
MSNSRVGSPEAVLAELVGVRSAAICGHVNPDGDCLGSNLALAELLRALGIQTSSLLAQPSPPPDLYAFLEGYEFIAAADYTQTPDLFIIVDAPSLERIGDAAAIFKRARRTLVIDHHPEYAGVADLYFGDVYAPATASLVWQLIEASGIQPNRRMAEYCYVAIMTDTGRFSFQNTDAEAFEQAARMVHLGARPTWLSQRVYENKPIGAVRLESRLVERIHFACAGAVVYSWINEQDFSDFSVSRDDTEGLPTILRSLAGVEVAALLREETGSVRVNLRSRAGLDVGAFARAHGGGGHEAAAGLTLQMTLAEALESFIPQLVELVCKE